MFKKMIVLLSALAAVSCGNWDSDDYTISQERCPLTALAVRVGDSYYHAKIDQDAHTAVIGAISNASTISGVEFTLLDDDAVITPDPRSFIGKWKKEQTVVVNAGGKDTGYTICLPNLKEETQGEYIFFDDFDVDGQPDPTKWRLCPKGTSDWNNEMSESYDQAYVKNGNLVLVAEKVDGEYKAGGIKTEGLFGFTFGKVECRARITGYPDGAFPAIWMMPQKYAYKGWPSCGEIDIMEHIRQESRIHHTIHTHYTYDLHMTSEYTNTAQIECDFSDYTVYACEWTPEEITFYVNGIKSFTYPNLHLADEAEMKQWPFNEQSEFYLILNMGLGNQGTWAGPVDDANLPAVMEIDWIRVTGYEEGE